MDEKKNENGIRYSKLTPVKKGRKRSKQSREKTP
jgi:hypothetical protein